MSELRRGVVPRGIGDARIRLPDAVRAGDVIDVSAIISHPMDTGLARKDEWTMIPAYFIETVTVTYGDRVVARFRWSTAISRDPIITFKLRADQEAPLTMVWRDNRGEEYTASTPVRFSGA